MAPVPIMPRWLDLRTISLKLWLIVLAIPCIHLITILVLRDHAGPFYLWSNLDPDYWYLLDALNITNLDWPVAVHHPGTPVQALGAFIIKLAHPLSTSSELTQLVLKNPEHYLTLIHFCLVVINTLALIFAGLCTYLAFGSTIAVLFVQFGPFISKLCIKWMTHVAPEPVLISVVLVLGGVALLALRPGQLESHRPKYAALFGLIAGFGLAVKITSTGVYFLPVFILWNFRYLTIYGLTALFVMFVFTLPAAGGYGDMIAHLNSFTADDTSFGGVNNTFVSGSEYLYQLKRLSSRPAFILVLLSGLITTFYFWLRAKANKTEIPIAVKLIAGICLADVVQVLIVAKHPSGHYMIPVLVLSTLGMALLYQIWMDQRRAAGSNGRALKITFVLLFVGLVGTQTTAMVKLDKQFKQRVTKASLYDDTKFDQCARIYFWAAATPSYPLQLGDDMVGHHFAQQLSKIRPSNDFWYEIVRKEFRDWVGVLDVKEIAAQYPCIYARGSYPSHMSAALKTQLPTYDFSASCTLKNNNETVFTSGVDCMGTLVK